MYRSNREFLELQKEIKKMDRNLNRFMNVRLKAEKELTKKRRVRNEKKRSERD